MYYPIKLKSIIDKHLNDELVNKNIVDKLLKQTILEFPFSTFPYFKNKNSKQSLPLKQGNCVGLSLYLQKLLKKQGIKSVLIPAGVPNKYKHPGYIDISHCALSVFDLYGNIFLCDPAFYFNESLHLNVNSLKNNAINSTNIYSSTIQKINFVLDFFKDTINLNQYQTIPKDTLFIKASHIDDPHDSWNYYLIQVTNPDQAISTYFINLKNLPFITILDSSYNLSFLMKFISQEEVIIKQFNKPLYTGSIFNIPNQIADFISSYLGNNWEDFYLSPEFKKSYFFNDKSKSKSKKKKNKKINN